MEVSIFTRPDVHQVLARFIELRLHTDDPDPQRAQKNKDYQWKLVNNPATPYYAIVDPAAPDKPVAEFPSADLPFGSRFKRFLQRYLGAI